MWIGDSSGGAPRLGRTGRLSLVRRTAAEQEAALTKARVHAAPRPTSPRVTASGTAARLGGSPRRESGAGEGRPRRDSGATSRTQGARSWPVPSGGGGGGAAPKIFLWQRKSTRQRKSRRRSGTAASGRDSRPGAESARGDNVATASQRATFRTPPWRQTGSALLALQEVPPASN